MQINLTFKLRKSIIKTMKSIIKALTIIKKQKTSKRVKLYFNKREHDVVAFWIEKFTYLSKHQVYKLISL